MRFCKSLETSDYQVYGSIQHIKNMRGVLPRGTYPIGNDHREWEYGITLEALRQNNTVTVLEVGGGGSLFTPAAVWIDMKVLQVDPGDVSVWTRKQYPHIKREMPHLVMDFFDYPEDNQFDAVTSISVIEHVGDTARGNEFFQKLTRHVKPGGLLSITTDFHPSGKPLVGGHHRCYNPNMLHDLIVIGQEQGFEIFGDKPDYKPLELVIDGLYSFCALSMKRTAA